MDKITVLIIDDNPAEVAGFAEALNRTAEFDVTVEPDSTHAVAAAKACQPDLIIVDILMPLKDGGEVARSLAEHPLFRETPIILLTGKVATELDAAGSGLSSGNYRIMIKSQALATKVAIIANVLFRGSAIS